MLWWLLGSARKRVHRHGEQKYGDTSSRAHSLIKVPESFFRRETQDGSNQIVVGELERAGAYQEKAITGTDHKAPEVRFRRPIAAQGLEMVFVGTVHTHGPFLQVECQRRTHLRQHYLPAATHYRSKSKPHLMLVDALRIPVPKAFLRVYEEPEKRTSQAHVRSGPSLSCRADHVGRKLLPYRRRALAEQIQLRPIAGRSPPSKNANARRPVYGFVINDGELPYSK